MRTFARVAAWEQQCCGVDFEVGSRVTWTVVEHAGPDEQVEHLLGPVWGERVRYFAGRHDDEEATVSGVVCAIHELRFRTESQPFGSAHLSNPIQGSGWLTEVSVADPWVSKPLDEERESMSFDGWIVEMEVGE
jgi:hypothetical protein